MSRQEFPLIDDFHFPSSEELSQGRIARITERFRMPIRRSSIPGVRVLEDARAQAAAGGLAFLVFGFLAYEVLTRSEERISTFMLVVLAGAGLILGYCAIVTSLWVMSTTPRRPIVGLTLGLLALLTGLSLPALEANASKFTAPEAATGNCAQNIQALWQLVERYESETGLKLDYGSTSFLQPVWERYKHTEARTFFCADATSTQRILDRGLELSKAEFREISFSGGLFHPDMRLPGDTANGPPLLWEKENAHGVLGIQVYTAGIGAHRSSPNVLFARVAAFRDVEAAERREISRRAHAALEAQAGTDGSGSSDQVEESAAVESAEATASPAVEELPPAHPAALPRR